MKLEYVADANVSGSGGDLVRLFDFTSAEVKTLIEAIRSVLVTHGRSIQLSALEFIMPLNCALELVPSVKDIGLRKRAPGKFTCELTRPGFLRMVELMEPFTQEGTTGFQWLYDPSSEDDRAELLLSPNGQW